jgi:hypothetical protein
VPPTTSDPASGPAEATTGDRSSTASSTRVTRPGGDVEVAMTREGDGISLRGTWRRLGLRALWAVPLVAVEAAVLGALWWQLPAARPLVLLVALLVVGRHLRRGWRELRGLTRGWVVVDADGIRGVALGTSLRWSQVREARVSGDLASPTVGYVPTVADVPPRQVRADVVPTDRLLDVLLPEGLPVALGDPAADPLDVTVAEEGVHVRPVRGRPVSMRWEALLAVEVTARPAGEGRLARSLELLGEVRTPGAARTREELVSLPLTVAATTGVLDVLRRVDATLPERAAASPAGTHELWAR